MEQPRCKGKLSSGDQCSRDSAEGLDLCDLCANKTDRNIYNLAVDSDRIQQLLTHRNAATLNAEEAMTRRLLELTWIQAGENGTLVLQATDIAKMLQSVKDMVVANHALQKSRNTYLDATQVNELTEIFLAAVNENVVALVKDEVIQQKLLQRIGERVVRAIQRMGN